MEGLEKLIKDAADERLAIVIADALKPLNTLLTDNMAHCLQIDGTVIQVHVSRLRDGIFNALQPAAHRAALKDFYDKVQSLP